LYYIILLLRETAFTSQLPAALHDSAHRLHHRHYVGEILIHFFDEVPLAIQSPNPVPVRPGEQRGPGFVHGRDDQPAGLVDDVGHQVGRQQRIRQRNEVGESGAHLLLAGLGQQHVRGGGQHVDHVRAVGGREDFVEVLAERADHSGRFRAIYELLPLALDIAVPGSSQIRGHRAIERVDNGLLHFAVRDERLSTTRQIILHLFQSLAGHVLKFDLLGHLLLVVGFFLDVLFLLLR